ncbi:SDR family NAD(P)-dependent oxidoreductase [Anaeromyxobacter sp. Fw109-5]|uniref:SDR family NAD(P)-dependent oxidoreductase n=1 Tax=Anaeromyxobacter sp. (strain Fw109-5) TaxID=404589 RepID=UPI0000ED7E52|nr:SDR family oxidoreductase [Anaeromyxobacter sp. Fw109-5]ABS25840.1 short-chain dehydrogenase/reductase SDR [Anaeromyxobacter sp. Fw109-5]
MDLQLAGRTAVVTAGTAGIGHAIAAELAAEGAHVVVTGRSRETLEGALAALPDSVRDRVRGVAADVGTAEGAAALVRAVPRADILVNNLGVYEPRPFEEIPDADWARLFEVNVMSGVRLSRAYLPGMRASGWGRILFISSESAFAIPAEMIHYGMTKAAQVAVARGIAETTKGTRITSNVVLPGPTRSAGIVEFLHRMSSNPAASDAEVEREFFERHRPASLLQRLIDAREVAHLVAYLASPLSSATNGAALRVEGGLLRQVG